MDEKDELNWLKEFVEFHQFNRTTTAVFKDFLNQKTEKNIDWFFNDCVSNAYNADYKITSTKKEKDLIYFSVKKLRKGAYPLLAKTSKVLLFE